MCESCGNEVFHHFLLPVDRDSAARERAEVDAVAAAGEPQLHALVLQAFAHHPFADARGLQDVDALMLENARAHAMLDVVPALDLEHHGVDAAQMQ